MSEWRDKYRWLWSALETECDTVIDEEFDWGESYAIGCSWGEGEARKRHAVMVERTCVEGGTWIDAEPDPEEDDDYVPGYREGGVSKQISTNALISEGKLTREAVVSLLLEVRPEDWKRQDKGTSAP